MPLDALCYSLFAAGDEGLQLAVEVACRAFVIPDKLHVFSIIVELTFTLRFKHARVLLFFLPLFIFLFKIIHCWIILLIVEGCIVFNLLKSVLNI